MLEAWLVFAVFTALGAATMAPACTFGDAGELAAAGATLGLPHAPSYPLFVALARAFGAAVPLGNWAYRCSLLSCVCGAGALALLCDGLRRLGCARPARLSAVGALGLCAAWRLETGVTEVFALHLLLCSGVLWLLCSGAGRLLEGRRAAALGLAFGLGLADHQTILLGVPAALSAAGPERASRARLASALALACLFGALGLGLYLFLPLRSARRPPLDWDHPTTAARLWRVAARKDYGTLSLTTQGAAPRGLAGAAAQTARFARESWKGLGPLSAAGLAGLCLWPAGWTLGALPFWLWLLGLGPGFLALGSPPFDALTSGALVRFGPPAWLALAAGAAALLERLWRLGRPGRAAALCAAAALLGWAAWSSPAGWRRADFASYDYGRNILKTLPPRAALFMDGGDDTFYALEFLVDAQGLRPDLELHDRGGVVFPSAYGPDFRRLAPAAKEARRARVEALYAADGRLYYSTLAPRLAGLELSPVGLLRAPASSKPRGGDPWAFYARRWSDAALARGGYRDRALVAFYPFMRAEAALAARRPGAAVDELRLSRAMAGDALWAPSTLAFAFGVAAYQAAGLGRWALARTAAAAELALEPSDAAARRNLAVIAAHLAAGARR